MEPFTVPIGLRIPDLAPGMINVIKGKEQFIVVFFRFATKFCPSPDTHINL